MQGSWGYLSYKLSYSQFCLKFRCHGNKGRSEVNLNDPVELAVPENHTLEPKITNLSCIQLKLWSFTSRKVGRSVVGRSVRRRSVLITGWTVVQRRHLIPMGKPQIRPPHRIETPNLIEIIFGTVDYVGRWPPAQNFMQICPWGGGFSANGWNIHPTFLFTYTFFSETHLQVRPLGGF